MSAGEFDLHWHFLLSIVSELTEPARPYGRLIDFPDPLLVVGLADLVQQRAGRPAPGALRGVSGTTPEHEGGGEAEGQCKKQALEQSVHAGPAPGASP